MTKFSSAVAKFQKASWANRRWYLRTAGHMASDKVASAMPWSTRSRIERMVRNVHPITKQGHSAIAHWAKDLASTTVRSEGKHDSSGSATNLSVVAERELEQLKRTYESKYQGEDSLRVLVHHPPLDISVATRSFVDNIVDGLGFLGVSVQTLEWDTQTQHALDEFEPSVFLTFFHESYLDRINWSLIADYRRTHDLALGLFAEEGELYGFDRVGEALRFATAHDVTFFFKSRAPEYVSPAHHRIQAAGLPIISLEYGANPLAYKPSDSVIPDLDYAFIGSLHRDKWKRYASFFDPILRRHVGFLLGPGWPTGPPSTLPIDVHRFVYARARVGLNLHHEGHLVEPQELNERTYQLAASGLPQVIDRPALLRDRFSEEAMFIADTPRQYAEAVETVLSDPEEASRRAKCALVEVMQNHTIFHRVERLVTWLLR